MKRLASAVRGPLVGGWATQPAAADSAYPWLPVSQAWANIGLSTPADGWAGAPGIIGFRGDNSPAGVGIDPQTILFDDTPANSNWIYVLGSGRGLRARLSSAMGTWDRRRCGSTVDWRRPARISCGRRCSRCR